LRKRSQKGFTPCHKARQFLQQFGFSQLVLFAPLPKTSFVQRTFPIQINQDVDVALNRLDCAFVASDKLVDLGNFGGNV
jgi:hypothetical protein